MRSRLSNHLPHQQSNILLASAWFPSMINTLKESYCFHSIDVTMSSLLQRPTSSFEVVNIFTYDFIGHVFHLFLFFMSTTVHTITRFCMLHFIHFFIFLQDMHIQPLGCFLAIVIIPPFMLFPLLAKLDMFSH